MSSKKCVKVTKKQLETIVETMEQKKEMFIGTLSKTFSSAQKKADWEELVVRLNSQVGAKKTLFRWQKCWSDYKMYMKKRFKQKKVEGAEKHAFSALEERVFALLMNHSTSKNTEQKPTIKSEPTVFSPVYVLSIVPNSEKAMTSANTQVANTQSISSSALNSSTEFDSVVGIPAQPGANGGYNVSFPESLVQTTMETESQPTANSELKISFMPDSVQQDCSAEPLLAAKDTMPKSVCTDPSNSKPNLSKKSSEKFSDRSETKGGFSSGTNGIPMSNSYIGALGMIARALESMGETQKAMLEIEERKVCAFEKFVEHFCV